MIACDPEKEAELAMIADKPRLLHTYDDLAIEGELLREKLKTVNKNLDRIVKKEITSNQILRARENPSLRALIEEKGGGDREDQLSDRTKELLVLDSQLVNSFNKKATLKQEFTEVEKRIKKCIDPEVIEKSNLHLAYLDEMIRGEQLAIGKYNDESKAFMRLDFTQKEVDGEKRCVAMEADLNRVKLTIDKINVEQQHSFQRSNKIQERIKFLNVERVDLEKKLAVYYGQELSVKPQTYSEKVIDAEIKRA